MNETEAIERATREVEKRYPGRHTLLKACRRDLKEHQKRIQGLIRGERGGLDPDQLTLLESCFARDYWSIVFTVRDEPHPGRESLASIRIDDADGGLEFRTMPLD